MILVGKHRCELQTAYQTASGKRKAATAAMAAGSNVHQALGKRIGAMQISQGHGVHFAQPVCA